MTEGNRGQVDAVWFDDIVISTEYIGQMGVFEGKSALPDRSILHVYPNPSNSTSTIHYNITVPGIISLSLYDVTGYKIAAIEEGFRFIGKYSAAIYGGSLPSGLYLLSLSEPGQIVMRKLLFIR